MHSIAMPWFSCVEDHARAVQTQESPSLDVAAAAAVVVVEHLAVVVTPSSGSTNLVPFVRADVDTTAHAHP